MRFRLPANIDMPDRIVAGLTFRQLVILAIDALVIWGLFLALGSSLPPAVLISMGVVMGAAGLALATSTPEGLGIEKLLLLAARFFRTPKQQVVAPEGIPESGLAPSAAPIRLPINGLTEDGYVDLGRQGRAAICRATGINLTLRSEKEQSALIEAFSRFLNSLDGPVQILVVSRPVDLKRLIGEMAEGAAALEHPALRRAAGEHIAFLKNLTGDRNARRRELLICFRSSLETPEAEMQLRRRVEQAQGLLRGLGIALHPLQTEEAAACVSAVADPEQTSPDRSIDHSAEVVEGRR